jgi:TrmH family RNA methyltransferase
MIVSQRNPKIKYVRRLQASGRFRRKESAYVAEGTRWLSDIVQSGLEARLVLFTEDWAESDGHRKILDQLQCEAAVVSPEVMKSISSLETSEGILTVFPITQKPLPENPSLILIADGVADPGNLGTMIRTAAAAGADSVILAPGCVDAYNPKVVRGAMGAHLRIGIHRLGWAEIASVTESMNSWIADAGDYITYDQVDWKKPSALIVGSEAAGVSAPAEEMFENRITIPMIQSLDSLNVAVAAGIILFESVRQRLSEGMDKSG